MDWGDIGAVGGAFLSGGVLGSGVTYAIHRSTMKFEREKYRNEQLTCKQQSLGDLYTRTHDRLSEIEIHASIIIADPESWPNVSEILGSMRIDLKGLYDEWRPLQYPEVTLWLENIGRSLLRDEIQFQRRNNASREARAYELEQDCKTALAELEKAYRE